MPPLNNITREEALGLGVQGGVLGTGVALGTVTPQGAVLAFSLGVLGAIITPPAKATSAGRPVDVQATFAATREKQWILGEKVRVGGHIVFAWEFSNKSKRVDVAVVLSAEKLKVPSLTDPNARFYVWLEGERIACSYYAAGGWWEPVAGTRWTGGARFYLNFAADGTQGQDLQDVTRYVAGTNFARLLLDTHDSSVTQEQDWDDTHKLNGVSWIHAVFDVSKEGLIKRGGQFPGNGADKNFNRAAARNKQAKRRPPTLPSMSFRVDGIQTSTDPTGSAGTTNSADIAYWVLTERLGFPASAIDATDLAAARLACNASVTRVLGRAPNAVTITIKPYAFSGIIQSGDDPLRILRMIEYLWHGYVAFSGDKVYLRPGSTLLNRPAVSYGYADGLTIESVEHLPPGKRFNAVRLALAHCVQAQADGPTEVPLAVNTALKAIDGAERLEQLRPSAIIRDYYQGQHWSHVEAAALGQRLTCKALLPYTAATAALVTGQPVNLTASEYGWSSKQFVLEELEQTDGPIRLWLREALPDSAHNVRAASAFTLFGETPIQVGSNLVGLPSVTVSREDQILNGEPFSDLNISWQTEPQTRLQVRWSTTSGTYPSTIHDLGASGQGRLAVAPLSDVYWQARLIDDDASTSDWTTEATAHVTKDTSPPAAPAGVTVAELPGGYRLAWTEPSESDYSHTTINDAQGTESTNYGTSATEIAIFPPSAAVAEPAQRTYTIRHVDTTGNASPATTGTVYPLPVVQEQHAYIIGTTTVPTVPAESTGDNLNPGYTPTGWSRTIPSTTTAKPKLWRITRTLKQTNPQTYTDWDDATPVQVESDGITIVTPGTDPSALPAPATPVAGDFTITRRSDGFSIALTANPTGGNYYEIEWGITSSSVYTRIDLKSGIYTGPVNIDGLAPSTDYTLKFRLRNYFSTASGDYSTDTFTTAQAVPPRPTTTQFPAIAAGDITATTVKLIFSRPATPGLTVHFEWGTVSGSEFTQVGQVNVLYGTVYTVRGLTPGTAYTFHMSYLQGGMNSSSRDRTATTKAASTDAPAQPTAAQFPAIAAGNIGSTTITVPFTLPSTYGLAAELEWGTLSGSTFTRVGIQPGLTSGPYIIRDLTPSTAYRIRLRYRIQGGAPSAYREQAATTKAAAAPTPSPAPAQPTAAQFPAIAAGNIANTTITVPFTLPSTYGLAAELEWGIKSGNVFTRRGVQPGLTSSPYTVRGLTPNTTYTFRLRFSIQGGTKSGYREQSATTTNTKPPTPLGVAVAALDSTSIKVTWTTHTGLRTLIRWGPPATNWVSHGEVMLRKGAYGRYDIEGLTPNTNYEIRVYRMDDDDRLSNYFGQT